MTFLPLAFSAAISCLAFAKEVGDVVKVFHGFGAVRVSFFHAFNVVSYDSLEAAFMVFLNSSILFLWKLRAGIFFQ